MHTDLNATDSKHNLLEASSFLRERAISYFEGLTTMNLQLEQQNNLNIAPEDVSSKQYEKRQVDMGRIVVEDVPDCELYQ
jgi:hypothetical protein